MAETNGRHPRSATAIRFPHELHDQLRLTSEQYGWPVNWIVNQAVKEFLRDLLPPDQIALTRRREAD